jgi:uncharacterized protein (DUF1330 family)
MARGFMLADSVVFDQAEYDKYRAVVFPSVERHGGRFIIRGGRFERLEGTKEWHRLIGLEFASLDAARGWYRSPEYQALKAQRLRGARTDMVLFEETPGAGLPPGAAPAGAVPPAYLIVDVEIHDLETFRQYSAGSPAVMASAGGRYLSRGGPFEVAEGTWQPGRLVFAEFPSWDVLHSWYFGDEYQALARLRQSCATAHMVAVEGHAG